MSPITTDEMARNGRESARGAPAGVDDAADGGRRGRPARRAAMAMAVVLAVLVTVLATRPSALTQQAASPLLHKPAPPVVGDTLAGGGFRLSDQKGRWVVVNFFATWCVPCEREHPELVAFSRHHAQAGDASVLSVIFQDDPAEATRFFAERGGDWPVVKDPKGQVALDWGVTGIPESYVVDPDGVVAAKVVGGVDAGGLDRVLAEAQQANEARHAREGQR